jgi:hypothetical protein
MVDENKRALQEHRAASQEREAAEAERRTAAEARTEVKQEHQKAAKARDENRVGWNLAQNDRNCSPSSLLS